MVWGYQFSCVGRMYFALQRTGSLLHIICMLHLHTTWYNLIQELIQLDTTHVRTCSRSQRRSPECHLSKRSSHLRFPRIKLCATSCHNQFAAVPSSSQIPKIPKDSLFKWSVLKSLQRAVFTSHGLAAVAPCAMLRHAPSNAAGKLCSPHDLQATSDTPPGTAWTHREVESRYIQVEHGYGNR